MSKMSYKGWYSQIRSKLRFLFLTFLGLAIALMTNFPYLVLAQTSSINTSSVTTVPTTNIIAPTETLNSNQVKSELRGIWLTNVDSDVLFSSQKLEKAINRLQRLKFNTLYPTVWNRGYTLYPSEVAQKHFGVEVDPTPGLQNRDMLAETIQMGHARGFAVIPWFEYGLMTEDGSELMQSHPEWITKRQDGSQVFLHGENNQHRLAWLNPTHPEVQQFLTDLIVEAVKKYNVDGIQLDDHFGMPVELGYDDYTIALYKKQHFGNPPPTDVNDPEWMRWRAMAVTKLMLKISQAVKAVKPNCLVSLSPNPKEFSYAKFLQDWYSWVYMGLIDELIVQVYRDDIEIFIKEVSRAELSEIRQRLPVAIGILTGLRVQNIDMRQIKGQVKAVREMDLDGFSFFFYETLGQRDASFESLLFRPAMRPDIRSIVSSRNY